MDRKTAGRLFQKLSRRFPEARSELQYDTRFQLLVAVILSAQATDISVNAATRTLFPECPTPEAMLKAGEKVLLRHIRRIGLAPTKAKNVIKTCRILLEQYGGEVPEDRDALESLPGVGRKTANVVLNEGFGHPTIAVDTHVFRLSNRTGLAPSKNTVETENRLLEIIPEKWKMNAHRYLIMQGRYVCKAKNYNCSECVIVKECEFHDKHFEAAAPVKSKS
ncbi:endonuclease III [Nitrospina watsonii]|uniref:Endonuclease III n=1 Tax=Nitrospina watsonii TaxID=1323948 RepID=A0ABM9HDS1_9BACT|nr:endonuclease III [Nitrospina watsonii]CAI2718305.1 endonuclease III [Nitrospina watsonii]